MSRGSKRFKFDAIVSEHANQPQIPSRYQGVGMIFAFNWPWYLLALVVSAAAIGVLASVSLPLWTQAVLVAGTALALYGTAASLLVSHWVYDRSPLREWTWLQRCFQTAPKRWVNIHAGFDFSSKPLLSIFPPDSVQVLDIFDPDVTTEGSIKRAQGLLPEQETQKASLDNLPLLNQSQDAVFLLLAAHEVRQQDAREKFFAEVKRVLKPGGRAVIVEHLRDTPNFLAFGPGFFHFLPRSEWLRLAGLTRFNLVKEFRITPFIRVMVLEA